MYVKDDRLYFEEINDFGENKPIRAKGPSKPSALEISENDEEAIRAVKKL